MKDNAIENVSPEQALEILKRLAKDDSPAIRKQIEREAERVLKTVDVEEVCEEVYSALDGIDVHELWDRSGAGRDGYCGPEEMAVEMMEEELEPFSSQVFRYLEMGMANEAKLYCMGVLKGIYQYEQESQSEFKDWAADIPGDSFDCLLSDWKKKAADADNHKEMREFVNKECGKWGKGR